MSRQAFKWISLISVPALAVLILSVYLTATPRSVQPKITWSENHIEVILSPGESTSKNLAFTSTLDIQNIVLEAVPEIGSFLSPQPKGFPNVPAGQPQSVNISFFIPEGTVLGTYDGTVHVRIRNKTLPQTLKVVVNVWNEFSSPQGDYSVHVPPRLEPGTPPSEGTPLGTPFNLIQSQVFIGSADLGYEVYLVRVYDNPSNLPPQDWLAQSGTSDYRADTVISSAVVGGIPGIQLASKQALRLGFYVTTAGLIYAIEWPNYDPENTQGLEQFTKSVNSLSFQ